MAEWYNRKGERIDTAEASRLLGDPTQRRVARTEIFSASDPKVMYTVSTVWLGLDHNYYSGGAPLIFETMAFGDSMAEELCCRYSSEDEATAGHAEVVATVAATVPDDVVTDVA